MRFAIDPGDPIAAPGAEHHYSDTCYVLLGAVLETQTSQSFAAALRQLLRFDEVGLNNTFVDDAADKPAVPIRRAHQYVADIDVSTVSPTIDLYGGGGIVTTTGDLSTFFEALLAGRVFDNDATLTLMTTPTDPTRPQDGALRIYPVHAGTTPCWYHDAFWGVQAMTCPELDITLTRSWNQTETGNEFDPAAADLNRRHRRKNQNA